MLENVHLCRIGVIFFSAFQKSATGLLESLNPWSNFRSLICTVNSVICLQQFLASDMRSSVTTFQTIRDDTRWRSDMWATISDCYLPNISSLDMPENWRQQYCLRCNKLNPTTLHYFKCFDAVYYMSNFCIAYELIHHYIIYDFIATKSWMTYNSKF